jgi:hypothetical protein
MGNSDDLRQVRPTRLTRRLAQALGVSAALVGWLVGHMALAVTPESPEVRKLVAEGLKALEAPIDPKFDPHAVTLGGRCVMGLAFLKANQPNHPRVQEAVDACRAAMTSGKIIDIYSNGLAIIFLCELAPKKHQREIQWYLNLLTRRQKPHGGWGYDGNNHDSLTQETGDTSQTQYATFALWAAFRNGFRIDSDVVERAADWLLRTQDPAGGWAYQGTLAQGSQRVAQSYLGCSMLAAGLGSTLICADLFDAVPSRDLEDTEFSGWEDELAGALPAVLRAAAKGAGDDQSTPEKFQSKRIDAIELIDAIDLAQGWMEKNYIVDIGSFTYYYLYSTERYQSFHELFSGVVEEEPKWYNDGYQYLVKNRRDDKGWRGGCGDAVDTAFGILFLLRSTQKSIRGTLGEGKLTGGRGLPSNVARARLRGNEIIVEQVLTHVDELLSLVDDSEQSRLDELARDPANLIVDQVDQQSARRLQQLVRGGEPAARLLAVRALGRTGQLDYAPTLIHALTDPEPRIVLEARDGLRRISRRFEGFGPPDQFTDRQRYQAIDGWKHWYQSLRSGALLEP